VVASTKTSFDSKSARHGEQPSNHPQKVGAQSIHCFWLRHFSKSKADKRTKFRSRKICERLGLHHAGSFFQSTVVESTMVALFSALQSSANAEATVSSSSSIPTLIQLYQTKAIHFDPDVTLSGHAVLSYQAIEVKPPSTDGGAEQTLFGQKLSKAVTTVNPNLGVWNCLVTNASKEAALVDKLMKVPAASSHYCFTVDATDPSKVEPAISDFQEALVRLMIEQAPTSENVSSLTTNLAQLRKTTFGLAPNDTGASSQLNTTAPAEADDKVIFALMIVALLPPPGTFADAYKETQAQALILYHLRRYAAALNATLVFVSDTTSEDQPTPTMTIEQLTLVWKDWAQGLDSEDHSAMYGPGKQQDDLIETVLLRNAHCPGNWEASTDSLWKALPVATGTGEDTVATNETKGDDSWLTALRDSVVMDAPPAPSTPAAASTQATPKAKEDAAAASSFFENLLNS
jgi:hypothetical protein